MATKTAASGYTPVSGQTGAVISRPQFSEVSHPDYDNQELDWNMMSDLYGGARVVKARGAEYLIMTELESGDQLSTSSSTVGTSAQKSSKSRYHQRLERSPYINGIERLTRFAMSHLFRETVTFPGKDEWPDQMKKLVTNADLLGTELNRFIYNVSSQSYVMGHHFILVEMPDTRKVESREDELKGDFRPYWVSIDPRDILNWSISRTPDGRFELDWIVHKNQRFTSEGPFDEPDFEVSYKIWFKDHWEEHVLATEGQDSVLTLKDEGPNPIGRIPIVPIYSNMIRPMISNPPLLESAFLNIDHYNMNSMLFNGLMFHLNPLLVFKGITGDASVKRGADYAAYLPQNADAEYVEYSGQSLSVANNIVEDLSNEITEAGLRNTSFLGANTSAEARRLSRSDFNAFLQSVASSLSRGYQEALEITGLWLGEKLTPEQTRVKINTDFDVVMLDAAQAEFMLRARAQGEISKERFFDELRRGEFFSRNLDIEEEIKRAAKDGPSMAGLTAAQLSGAGGGGAKGLRPSNVASQPGEGVSVQSPSTRDGGRGQSGMQGRRS